MGQTDHLERCKTHACGNEARTMTRQSARYFALVGRSLELDRLDAQRARLVGLVSPHAWTTATASSRVVKSSTASSVESLTTAQKSIAQG
jgi:hypothetical protein